MAWLDANPPARQQWYKARNRPLTGCTVLHSSESVMDTVGPDTGAENVARFIQKRDTPGSYHDLVDSDSGIHLVDYVRAAFHDGTGSNNWALSISFALRTVDWARMNPARRAAFLHQGALRFVAQQQWRKRNGAPLTRLRYITKTESDAGQSGFCCHGWRDPGRRSDPGTTNAARFPFEDWLQACAVALAQHMPDHPDAAQGDDMPLTTEDFEQIADFVWGRGQSHGDWKNVPPIIFAADTRSIIGHLAGELASLRAVVGTLAEALAANRDDITADELKAHVTAEVDRGMETFRARVVEGYDVRLQPKGDDAATTP